MQILRKTLFIQSPTIRAYSFLSQETAATATTITRPGKRTSHPIDKETDKGHQENIANIDTGGPYKEKITYDAGRCQSQQIRKSRSDGQLPEQDIHHSQKYHHDKPQAGQEQSQDKRDFQG